MCLPADRSGTTVIKDNVDHRIKCHELQDSRTIYQKINTVSANKNTNKHQTDWSAHQVKYDIVRAPQAFARTRTRALSLSLSLSLSIYIYISALSLSLWPSYSLALFRSRFVALSCIACCKTCLATVLIRSIFAREKLHERFSASAVFPAQNRTN